MSPLLRLLPPAALLSVFISGCTAPPSAARIAEPAPSVQTAAIAGAWRTTDEQENYLWHFLNDHTFSNERGSQGTWTTGGGAFVAVATNQGRNPTTWRLRPSTDGHSLHATWSDPSGLHGSFVLVRK